MFLAAILLLGDSRTEKFIETDTWVFINTNDRNLWNVMNHSENHEFFSAMKGFMIEMDACELRARWSTLGRRETVPSKTRA